MDFRTFRHCFGLHRSSEFFCSTRSSSGLATAVLSLAMLLLSGVVTADPLSCAGSPFGTTGSIIQNVEFMDLVSTGASTNVIEEYRPATGTENPPITQLYQSNLYQGALTSANGTFQKAINVDLNGDGRDEIAAVYLSGTKLTIAIYERASGLSPSATVIQAWSYTGTASLANVDIIAGDFDGSQDGKQELAVTWSESNMQHLGVLTGASNSNGDGVIANTNNNFSGKWTNDPTVSNPAITRLARGDFLLDGRDQIAVVSNMRSATPIELDVDLLEYGNLQTRTALPVRNSDVNIGSQHNFDIGSEFISGGSGYPIQGIVSLTADGGDVVDSAAAELVVHEEFLYPTFFGHQYAIGQRLYHFARTPEAPGPITSVSLAAGEGPNVDATQIIDLGYSTSGVPQAASFDTTIADIDGDGKAEIVVARDVVTDNGLTHTLNVSAYRSTVVPRAGFTYAVNGFTVTFTNTSKAAISYSWNFGDGSSSTQPTPSHLYSSNQNYTIPLTASDASGASDTYQATVNPGNNATGSGGIDAAYNYRLVYAPISSSNAAAASAYSADLATNGLFGYNHVQLAAGPMNHDGLQRALVMAFDVLNEKIVRGLAWFDDQNNFALVPNLQEESNSDFASLGNVSLLASDFDGESMHATLTTGADADCRTNVVDRQLRSLIWMPPYFAALQTQGIQNQNIDARFAKTNSTSQSQENQEGSYSSNSVSGYVGETAGFELGPLEAEDSVKFTFGGDFESATGAIHGSDQEYSYTEGSTSAGGEALVQSESTTSDCYTYDVVRYGGAIPNSTLHFCAIQRAPDGQPRDSVTDSNADVWNSLGDQSGAPFTPTPQWFPLTRDWASLALFHPAMLNGSPVNGATDGLFSTPVTSSTMVQPYLDIDLGAVRDIASIRVFPAANVDTKGNLVTPLGFADAAKDLVGFRIYVSMGKFVGAAIPSGANVTSFAPDTADQAISDRWNVWTRNPSDNSQLLRGRYVRLQNPSTTPSRINIAEIQVFGDSHVEPPTYPDAVCDPSTGADFFGNPLHNDGYFKAEVWNSVDATPGYQEIEVRGDLMWSGANAVDVHGNSISGVPNCANDEVVRDGSDIWGAGFKVSGSSTNFNSWDLGQTDSTTLGTTASFDTSFRIGAEYDIEAGFGVKVTAGLSYEYTHGVTSEIQSSTTWGNELSVGGDIAGFDTPSIGNICGYEPRPYAFHLNDRSNAGFQHDVYVADYIVREGSSSWTRAALPTICKDDRIFYDNVELYH
jgi:hypothetical protein